MLINTFIPHTMAFNSPIAFQINGTLMMRVAGSIPFGWTPVTNTYSTSVKV